MAILRAGYAALALRLQEAMDSGDALSAGDIRCRLSDAINDAHRGTGKWAYYIDHFGDGESGDVIYCCDGDTCRASYAIADTAGAAKCVIDFESAEDVVPRTIYEVEGDEEEHYAAMEAAYKAEGFQGMPLYERFISKKERDAASGDDFAGKGKSYPILKPEDVMAAARSIGRAGADNKGPTGLKNRIIAIAKRKGWEKYLPKAWQDGGASTSEAAISGGGCGLRLVECAATTEVIELQEAARAGYEIKLIAPGKGAMAYYPADVLKRDGPTAFPAETKVYVNHPTKSQESEGAGNRDVYRLAGVLTTAAEYKESHAKGPGLFARVKVFADHAQMFEEKGKYLGMSIMANGKQAVESGKPAVREGLPVLGQLTRGESVDVVPIAGAGGMILQESAAEPAEIQTQEAVGMTADEVKKLVEAEVRAARLPDDARAEATRLLETVSFKPETKLSIVDSVLRGTIPVKEGVLDREAFGALVVAEAQRVGKIISAEGGTGVRGMGIAPAPQPKPEDIAAREAAAKNELASDIELYEALGMDRKAAEFAAKGRAA